MSGFPPDVVRYSGFALLLGAGASYAAWQFFRLLRRDRYAADTPLTRIRSAAQGYVRVEGITAPAPREEALCAPLTGRLCVWWDYQIDQWRSINGRSERWECIDRGTSVTPFALRDADAQCLIGPVGAEIIPTECTVWHGSSPKPVAPPAAFPVPSLGGSYRYTESVVAADARITVLGELRSHSVIESIDDEARSILGEWKHDQATLLARFDRNCDGHLDADEWEAVRQAAKAQAATKIGGPDSRLSVVGQTTHGQPFLIAPMAGAALAAREKRLAGIAFVAAVVLAGLTAWAVQRALTTLSVTVNRPLGTVL